jgi:enterochelin esterase-like enzyme
VAFHFYVYFPPCYEASQKRYPVLYLLHGMNADDTQWLNLGLAKTADALIGAGAMPPLIIVLPRDPDIRQPAESEFDEWLLNDLLPWIDGTYRTNPNHRGLGGISRGGAWAVHIGLQHPERFQALGWHSPEIFWGDAQKIPRWLEAMPRQAIPQVYMDAGNNDTSLPRARWLQAQLRAFGVPHEWRLTLGYHEEKLWRAHLAEYLRWYGQALSP